MLKRIYLFGRKSLKPEPRTNQTRPAPIPQLPNFWHETAEAPLQAEFDQMERQELAVR
jgi:hypothetical protein